jgi:hypothetical protein
LPSPGPSRRPQGSGADGPRVPCGPRPKRCRHELFHRCHWPSDQETRRRLHRFCQVWARSGSPRASRGTTGGTRRVTFTAGQAPRLLPDLLPQSVPPPESLHRAASTLASLPATEGLAITDGASPFALRSTRNRPRTAVRRGAARPRRRGQAAAGETLSRAGRRPHRRACMGCRAPQAPSTRTRLGVPARGRSAWWPRRSRCRPRLRQPVHVLGQRPVSSVRCERPVSRLACPRDRCPVSGAGV